MTLLAEVEAWLVRTGTAPTALGQRMNDRHIVFHMRKGRRLWPETQDKLRAAMAAIEGEKA